MRFLFPILSTFVFCSAIGCAQPRPDSNPVGTAQQFVGHLSAGRYADAVAMMDATMQSAMPEAKLKELWGQLQQQLGQFTALTGETRAEKLQGYDICYVACKFTNQHLDAKVVMDPQGKIAGLFFLPAKSQSGALPDYVIQGSFTEQEVKVGSGQWELPGTLTIPNGKGPFPAVVLVHGSGPNDRDETIGPNKPFRDLAWGLASQGIAVLRYDKRTLTHQMKMATIANLTVKEEVVDDAVAAVAMLRTNGAIDPKRIYVLGHSLGGMLAPKIAAADPKIAGLVILAGATRPLNHVIVEQMTYLAGLDDTIDAKEQAQLAMLTKQAATIDQLQPGSTQSPAELMGVPASYWLDLKGYNAPVLASTLRRKILVLHGGRDYQVTNTDLVNWQDAARGHTTFKTFPNLNHLFMAGTGISNPTEYEVAGHVAPEVIAEIAGWIGK
ncbi:MAG: alpha/beta fold hydrolase [Chlorobi bacterium CHB2]|nr:alpha/beta fold hydrolase [Chlorobi bacterium CHB2]